MNLANTLSKTVEAGICADELVYEFEDTGFDCDKTPQINKTSILNIYVPLKQHMDMTIQQRRF